MWPIYDLPPIPAQVFLDPNPEFIAFLKHLAQGRRIVDCGAGSGRLTRRLLDAGANVLAIDRYPRIEAEAPILIEDATGFSFGSSDLAVLARPNRGDWIMATIEQALGRGAHVLYVGKRRNLDLDLDERALDAAESMFEPCGIENEIALLWTKPLPADVPGPGEVLVQLPFWSAPAPMRDGGDRWINRQGGWFSKDCGETIIKAA